MTFETRVQAVSAHSFTERQAAFLVTVMLHAGVCVIRQYCTFGRMVYGQTAKDFFARLVRHGLATVYDSAHSRARIFHLQSRPLYAAIGEPHSRFRKPTTLGRAVERLMVLDHVLTSKQIVWLASERDKLAHFTLRLGTSFEREDLPHLSFGIGERTSVRYFPYKLPIGVADGGRMHVFAYLVTRELPIDFRGFLQQHAELLRALPRWTLQLLVPQHLAYVAGVYERAAREELASPLRPSVVEEVGWYFDAKRRGASPADASAAVGRYEQAASAFSTARFRSLYRAWLRDGRRALHAATSPVLADALNRGTGCIERCVLPHAYLHLASAVGTA
jgi:hypothetical protein